MPNRKVRIEGIIAKPKKKRIVMKGNAAEPTRENLVDLRGMSNFKSSTQGTGANEHRSLINGKR